MKQRAFTLIETIVVIGIIIIFFAFTAPLFSRLGGTKLTTSARSVMSVLRTARGYAISENKNYYVKFDNSATPNEYYIYYDEAGADITVDKVYKLPAGIWFYKPGAADPSGEAIEFTADTDDTACFRPTGELEETGSNTLVYIADSQDANAKSKIISVEKTTGRIKIE